MSAAFASTLEIHVLAGEIVVNLTGARCTMTFEKAASSSQLIEKPFWTHVDRSAPISASAFRALALSAAYAKAKEVGWMK